MLSRHQLVSNCDTDMTHFGLEFAFMIIIMFYLDIFSVCKLLILFKEYNEQSSINSSDLTPSVSSSSPLYLIGRTVWDLSWPSTSCCMQGTQQPLLDKSESGRERNEANTTDVSNTYNHYESDKTRFAGIMTTLQEN